MILNWAKTVTAVTALGKKHVFCIGVIMWNGLQSPTFIFQLKK